MGTQATKILNFKMINTRYLPLLVSPQAAQLSNYKVKSESMV